MSLEGLGGSWVLLGGLGVVLGHFLGPFWDPFWSIFCILLGSVFESPFGGDFKQKGDPF